MSDVRPMLDVRIDSKSFSAPGGTSRHALRDIAFSVVRGEVVGILGPSGTGKTTMLRILLDLDAAFEGTVKRTARRVGVMFQEPRLLPWLTVGDNLRLVVADGTPLPDIAALLDEVRLPGAEALFPRQLSLGMARRVSLARALAVQPELLVLDEPFASLDPQLAGMLGAVMTGWARRTGGAVVLATHDLAQALDVVTRLLILTGQPATLAADLPVPPHHDAASRSALHALIIDAFGFLDAGGCRPGRAPPTQAGRSVD